MIAPILEKELRAFGRNRLFLLLVALIVLLCTLASLDGWRNAQSADQIRQHAADTDRKNWLEQGENNPHSSAHFARYAFRPTPALQAFEPGILDFAGSAVWMEAHYQNPASLRRAEDSLSYAPVESLSSGWVIRVVVSLALLVLLFQSVVQERERGTVQALAVHGVRAKDFVVAKLGAALLAALLLTLLAIALAIAPAIFVQANPAPSRIMLIAAFAGLGLMTFGLGIVAVSAYSRSSSSSMVNGAAIWLLWVVALPTLGAQLATTLHPNVEEQIFKSQLHQEAQKVFWVGDAHKKALSDFQAELKAQRSAKGLSMDGLNKDGMKLQAHEEFANAVYDRRFGELYGVHRRQDAVLRGVSMASPLYAMQRIWMGLASTDLLAQQAFARQAELHRRKSVRTLNNDMITHAGELGFKYKASEDLWQKILDFEGVEPSIEEVFAYYRWELFSIFAWFGLCAFAAFRGTQRAMRGGALS